MSPAAKDEALLRAIATLEPERRGWILVDHWEGDLASIGVARPEHPRRLAWVTTWGCPPGRVTVIVEVPTGPDPIDFTQHEVVTDEELHAAVRAIEAHLDGRVDGAGSSGGDHDAD